MKIGKMEFEKIPFTPLGGGKEVRFVEKTSALDPFTVVISRQGMKFGNMSEWIVPEKGFEELARFMNACLTECRALSPRILPPTNERGH